MYKPADIIILHARVPVGKTSVSRPRVPDESLTNNRTIQE